MYVCKKKSAPSGVQGHMSVTLLPFSLLESVLLTLRITASQKCEAVPKRARMQGAKTCVSRVTLGSVSLLASTRDDKWRFQPVAPVNSDTSSSSLLLSSLELSDTQVYEL